MNGEWCERRGHKENPWEMEGKGGRQLLGVLDHFRVFLEVKSPVERSAYFKTFGTHCSSGLQKGCSDVHFKGGEMPGTLI